MKYITLQVPEDFAERLAEYLEDGRIYRDVIDEGAVQAAIDTITANAPAPDGWIEWGGGQNPAKGKTIDVRFRNINLEEDASANIFRWDHVGSGGDIIAYRVVKQGD